MDQKWNRKSANDYTQLSNPCFGFLQCLINLTELWGDVPIVDTLSKREGVHTVVKLLVMLVFCTQSAAALSGV